MRAIFSRCDEP